MVVIWTNRLYKEFSFWFTEKSNKQFSFIQRWAREKVSSWNLEFSLRLRKIGSYNDINYCMVYTCFWKYCSSVMGLFKPTKEFTSAIQLTKKVNLKCLMVKLYSVTFLPTFTCSPLNGTFYWWAKNSVRKEFFLTIWICIIHNSSFLKTIWTIAIGVNHNVLI